MAIAVTEIGVRARAAVGAAGGAGRVVAALTRSIYLTAGTELVWLTAGGGAGHARAMSADALPNPPPIPGDPLHVSTERARPWRPRAQPATSVARLARGARALLGRLDAIGAPDGLGALLVGRAPAVPLRDAVSAARALVEACADDDPGAAAHAALPLLGLGPGLTPAGDDYVGGAFFARTVLGAAGARTSRDWAGAGSAVIAAAGERTNAISRTLLADLVRGEAYGALHDLAAALAGGEPGVEAARRLARLGHSSGWDVLAGFIGVLVKC